MKQPTSPKFNVAARVSTGSPKSNPDDILFSGSLATPPATRAEPSLEEMKMRFGSQLPAETLIKLHRVSYWGRVQLNELLDEALSLLYKTKPDAEKPLPEKERVKRKLPTA